MKLIWATLERMAPRLATALVTLTLAAVSAPSIVGVYSWGVLILTATQALSDQAVRQVLIHAVTSPGGLAFLKSYCRRATVVGGSAIIVSIAVLYIFLPSSSSKQVLFLLPLAAVPAAISIGIVSMGRLQFVGQWRSIANGRLLAATTSSLLGIVLLLLTSNMLSATVSTVVGELLFSILCRRSAKAIPETTVERAGGLRAEYIAMATYSGIAWMQGQLDRVVLGLLAGTAQLGAFTVAQAVARSAGDSISASTASVLRGELGRGGLDASAIRGVAQRNVDLGLLAALGCAILVAIGADLVLLPILGPQWKAPLAIVPVLALATIPSVLSWASAPIHIEAGSGGKANTAALVGIPFALAIGAAATSSLTLAAWMVVAREVAVATTQFVVLKSLAPWASYWKALGALLLGTASFAILGTAVR